MRTLLVVAAACLLAVLVLFCCRGDDAGPSASRTPSAAAPGVAEPAQAEVSSEANESAAAPAQREAVGPGTADRGKPATPSATELWGRVVDAGSKGPIGDVEVELLHRDADEFWNLDMQHGEQVASVARARTDVDGRFRFDVVRARPHRLRVQAAGYATVTVPGRVGGSEVLIELTGGATVTGTVKSGERLLADMDVRIAVQGESSELARARTDAGGAFRCVGLPPAKVYVQVSSPMFEEEWKQLEIEAGKQHHVAVEMKPGKTLRGRVVEATTGTPIVDAAVAASWTFKRAVRTDVEGRFQLAGLADDGYLMCHVRAVGYASAMVNVGGKLGDECVVRLLQGGEVVGRVVDGSGAPVAVAYVAVGASFMAVPGMQDSDWVTASVGPDGRFRALGLRIDQHYWLLARAPGFGTRVYALARMLSSGERLDVGDVVLRPAGGIEGRAVDDAGDPIAGASMHVSGLNTDSRSWLAGGEPTRVTQFESRSVPTDAAGVFRFAGLAAGRYEVRARAPWGREVTLPVDVVDGALQEGLLLTVPRGKAITGKLLLASGQPLGELAADMWFQASDDQGDSNSARITADGGFRIEGLSGAAYTLTMLRGPQGFVLAPLRGVVPGGPPMQLVLEIASFVAGSVVDQAGKPMPAQVYATSSDDQGALMHATDDQGRFRIEVPASFRGAVVAHPKGDWHIRGEVTEVAAGQSELVITIRKP